MSSIFLFIFSFFIMYNEGGFLKENKSFSPYFGLLERSKTFFVDV